MINGINNIYKKPPRTPRQYPGMFMWLLADYGITFNYVTQAGTIATTNGSAVITGTGTSFQDLYVGAKIQFVASGEVKIITARSSNTSITVDSVMTATASGLSYALGFVSNWADMLNVGYFASQALGANQPLWRAYVPGYSTKPMLYFNGNNQFNTNFEDRFSRLTAYLAFQDTSVSVANNFRWLLKMSGSLENHAMNAQLGAIRSFTSNATKTGTISYSGVPQNLLIGGFASGGNKHIGFYNRTYNSDLYAGNGISSTPATMIIGGGENLRLFVGHVGEIRLYRDFHPQTMIKENVERMLSYYSITP